MSKRKGRAARTRKDSRDTMRLGAPFTSEVLYHYTSTFHLSMIFSAGYLKLTSSDIIAPDGTLETELRNKAFRPVVWLTDSLSPRHMGLDGSAMDKKEIRITVVKRDYMERWSTWEPLKLMKKKWWDTYCKGMNWLSWYVTETEIPFTDILKIENVYDGTVYYEAKRTVA